MTDDELDATLRAFAEEIRMPEGAAPAAPVSTPTPEVLLPWAGRAMLVLAVAASLLLVAVPTLRSGSASSVWGATSTDWFDVALPESSEFRTQRRTSIAVELLAGTHPRLMACLDTPFWLGREDVLTADLFNGYLSGVEGSHWAPFRGGFDWKCVKAFGKDPAWGGKRHVASADLRLWPWESQRALFLSTNPREHRLILTMPPGSDAVLGAMGFSFYRVRGGGTFELETGNTHLYLVPYGGDDPSQVIRVGPLEGVCRWSFPEPGEAPTAPDCEPVPTR